MHSRMHTEVASLRRALVDAPVHILVSMSSLLLIGGGKTLTSAPQHSAEASDPTRSPGFQRTDDIVGTHSLAGWKSGPDLI